MTQILQKNKLIGCCGLDCGKCDARKATLENNDVLRTKVAAQWSVLNNFEIKPEWINCEGCRSDGVKTVFCEQMCEMRKCVLAKRFATCDECFGKKTCPTRSQLNVE